MFKLTKKPEFIHEVRVKVPVDGGFEEQTFKTRFWAMTFEQTDKFALGESDGMLSFLKLCIQEIYDIVDDDGKALDYNDKLRDQMLGLPYVRSALLETYLDATLRGRAKNS